MSSKHAITKDSTKNRTISLDTVREEVGSTIENALQGNSRILIEALPATGKSRSLLKAVEQTGESIIILTQRGREEQYDQVEQWCDDLGLSCKTLPAVDEICPTFQGQHDEELQKRVKELRRAGASPGRIHGQLNLPCQNSGSCPYEDAVEFNPAGYDVLVGHPMHAYVDQYLDNRIPVFDEFPGDAYLEKIEDTSRVVTGFLQTHSLPFKNYADLLENRSDEDKRTKARQRLTQIQLEDESSLFQQNGKLGHKLAGLCVLTLLESEDLDNRWEHAILGDGKVGVFNRVEDTCYILHPPEFPDHVLGLDGTPTKVMWDIALGFYDRRRRLTRQRVFTDEQRRQYLLHAQNLRVIPTTENVRPYSGGTTTPRRDAALLREISRQSSGTKGVISTRCGLQDIKEEIGGLSNWETAHFGNLLGSNGLGDVDVGVLLGSTHYGDRYVKQWGALAGIAVESNGEKGLNKSYGEFGDKVLQHMREHTVLQALFRFARQGDGATVFVDTICLPNWVPVVANPSETSIDKWDSATGKWEIIEALKQLGKARTKQLADKSGRSVQYVRRILNILVDDGVVSKQRSSEDGRGGAKVYVDEQLDQINPYGRVSLPDWSEPTRFSKLSRYRSTNGSVSKKTQHQLRVQRGRKEYAKHQRHRRRWRKQKLMERKYGLG